MKRIIIHFFSIFLFIWSAATNSINAQNRSIDSLNTCLQKDKADTNKVNHLNALGWIFMYIKPDTAIIMGKQALELANQIKNNRAQANSNSNLGVYFWIKGEYPLSLSYQFKALEIREELNDKKGISTSLGNIGIVYWNQKNYSKALEYLSKALKIAEEMGNKEGMAKNYGNIGVIYFQQKEYLKAIENYKKALAIDENLKEKTSATWLGNIGTTCDQLMIETANTKRKDSLFEQAIFYYSKALQLEKELGNNAKIARHLGNMGNLFLKKKNYSKAEEYLLKAIELSSSIGVLSEKMQFEYALHKLYNDKGNYDKALEYYKLHIADKDSLFSKEKGNEITRHEMNYEFEKKEFAAKAEQEKKDAVTIAESKKQRIVLLLVSCVLLLVFVFAGFIFRSLRITKKQKLLIEIKNKETEEQKNIITEKNKDILDSIRYAKRIQDSLLPTEKYIKKNLAELQK